MSVQIPFKPIADILNPLLAHALSEMEMQPTPGAIDTLAIEMGKSYDYAKESAQLSTFKFVCASHPLTAMIREDPYSRRAIDKPRGFAGDAVMLDYVYGGVPDGLSLRGRAIHDATTRLSTGRSVLWRREYLAEKVCDFCKRALPGKVLSVASGHMRELELVRARLGEDKANLRFWALDQDRDALTECIQSNPSFAIEPINKSILHVIKGALLPEQFDFIYSAGLSDYLEDKVLLALARALYAVLAPNGLLVIANFSPSSHGRGFMEGLLDWSLKYRSERELASILQAAIPNQKLESFSDPEGNVAYVEVRRVECA